LNERLREVQKRWEDEEEASSYWIPQGKEKICKRKNYIPLCGKYALEEGMDTP
jgi:hypothetical protein